MLILFRTTKLRKICNEERRLVRAFGQPRATILSRRLHDLRAAETLEVMRDLTGNCHQLLRGTDSGRLTVDLDQPYRLVFEPANDPIPKKADGGLDWKRITAIKILTIKDTHE